MGFFDDDNDGGFFNGGPRVNLEEARQLLLYSRESLDRYAAAMYDITGFESCVTDRTVNPGSELYGYDIVMKIAQEWIKENKTGHAISGMFIDKGVKRDAPLYQCPQLVAAVDALRTKTDVFAPDVSRIPLEAQEFLFANVWERGGRVFTLAGEVLPDDPDDPHRAEYREFQRGRVRNELKAIREARRRKLKAMSATQHFTGGSTSEHDLIRKDGTVCGSNRPYGRIWECTNPVFNKWDWVPVKHEQAVIWEVCGLHAEGQSMRAIAKTLNSRGEPTSTGRGKWTHRSIGKLLERGPFGLARGLNVRSPSPTGKSLSVSSLGGKG